ncbi:MAG: amino acid permease [Archaeoglobus sp.]|nr:amino acid permease [Archaeoglobus sp.]
MQPPQPSQRQIEVKLSRDLGFFDITMIGVAGMIGAGVFALTGIAAGVAGPALVLVFLLNGIIATITAAAYAELGSAMPGAGGGYVWIKETLPSSFGFLAGWIDWFAHSVACSLYAVTFGAFMAEILVGSIMLPREVLAKLSTFAAVTLLTYVNYRGVKETGRVGGFVTILKVLILVVFIGFGVYKTLSNPEWMTHFTTPSFAPFGMVGILAAMGLTYIAFEGYEIIVQSGEEVKNPEKNIPRAIFASLWIAVSIYILIAFSVLGGIEVDVPSWQYLGGLAELGLIRVSNQIMPFGNFILLVAGLVSTISAMNATIYSSSRVSFALARDGFVSEKLAIINDHTKTPHYAIFFTYVIISFMALTLPIEAVAAATDIMFILLFIMVNFVLIILRLKAPTLKRTFRVPLVPYIPIAAILFQLIIAFFLITEVKHGFLALFAAVGWIVFGVVVYLGYSKEKEKDKLEEEFKTVFEEKVIEGKPYKILVSIANPVVAKKLLSFAKVLAKARNGEIILLSVIRLPEQTPLSAGRKYVTKQKQLLDELINLEVSSIPIGGMLKIAHSVPEAILNTIEEEKIDLLILGWRGRTFRRDYILGSTIDPILFKAPCDVAVIRFDPALEVNKIKKILIPTAGGPHARLAAEIALDFKEILGSEPTFAYFAGSTEEKERAKKYIEQTAKVFFEEKNKEEKEESEETKEPKPKESEEKRRVKAEEEKKEFNEMIKVSRDKIGSLIREADKFDAIFLGASDQPFLKNLIRGAFPEIIARRTTKTVVMVRKKIEISELLKLRFWR